MDGGEYFEDEQDVWEDDGKRTEVVELEETDDGDQASRCDVLGWLAESPR